jgi:hypothetical protein
VGVQSQPVSNLDEWWIDSVGVGPRTVSNASGSGISAAAVPSPHAAADDGPTATAATDADAVTSNAFDTDRRTVAASDTALPAADASRPTVAAAVPSTSAGAVVLAPTPPSYAKAIDEIRTDPIFNVAYLYPFVRNDDEAELAYAHACVAINALRAMFSVSIFKIGVCQNPKNRYYNAGPNGFGYHYWGYTTMALVMQGLPHRCDAMERRLCTQFRRIPGCQNASDGGEGIPKALPCFVYVVVCNGDLNGGGTWNSLGPLKRKRG